MAISDARELVDQAIVQLQDHSEERHVQSTGVSPHRGNAWREGEHSTSSPAFSRRLGSPESVSVSLFNFVMSTVTSSSGPPPSAPHFPCLFYTSLSTWFSALCLFPVTGAADILVSMCQFPFSSHVHYPYHLSLFYAIFFAPDVPFTDPLTCSLLILSFLMTPSKDDDSITYLT